MVNSIQKSREIESRIIRIKLIDNTLITGQVNLNRESIEEYARLSDLLTKTDDQFLVLFSAMEMRHDLEQPIRHKTIFINKNHILWAAPESTQK